MKNIFHSIEYAKEQRKLEDENIKREQLAEQSRKREKIKREIKDDGTQHIFNLKKVSLIDTLIEFPQFYVLKKRTKFCDLHNFDEDKAFNKVRSLANKVAKDNSLSCIGFIHGRGVHSGDMWYFDDIDSDLDNAEYANYYNFHLYPVLKPMVRKELNFLANKLGCRAINGESFFKGTSPDKNSGITYFMNMKFYSYYEETANKWNNERIWLFQEFNSHNSL